MRRRGGVDALHKHVGRDTGIDPSVARSVAANETPYAHMRVCTCLHPIAHFACTITYGEVHNNVR